MSPDLRIATAYISPLGLKDGQPVIKALSSHAKFIRGRLARSLSQMKHMPTIRYQLDTSFDNYATIEGILKSPKFNAIWKPPMKLMAKVIVNGSPTQEKRPTDFRLDCT